MALVNINPKDFEVWTGTEISDDDLHNGNAEINWDESLKASMVGKNCWEVWTWSEESMYAMHILHFFQDK